MSAVHQLFATCPRGVEGLLAAELAGFGALEIRETVAGVACSGPLEAAYRACLWSRVASRILLTLAEVPAGDADALYAGVRAFPWEEVLAPEGTLAVDFTGTSPRIANTLFGAQKVKDAVVDRFRDRCGRRPSVDLERPDARLNVHLAGGGARVSLDLSGASLHRRGWRVERVAAPLKENLAAAILLRADWPATAAGGGPLLDPLCGSGTIPIEAACLAGDVAPGLFREAFGFSRWPGHDARLWARLLAEAAARRAAAARRVPPIVGTDRDPLAVRAALANVARAGFGGVVHVERRELADAVPPKARGGATGLVVANPPYGERLGTESGLRPLYETVGRVLRERFAGWRAALLTGNPGLALRTGIRATKSYKLFNGALPCRLFLFEVSPGRFMHASLPGGPGIAAGGVAESLANRLRKNLKTLGAWARREGVTCWRVYDADMPEYAVAVDRYRDEDRGEDWAVVQEYAAPKTVDPGKARARLHDAVATVAAELALPPGRVILKVRRRRRGREQHEKLGAAGDLHRVAEAGLSFLVNLSDYVDTGLFLDTRPVRALLRELAGGRRFLNLFSYTGTATVCAAAGGAAATVSVDLSNTYLAWARRNLEANAFRGPAHELVRADCREWLRRERRRFDLVYLDPPSFSTSNAMRGTLDVQRDHAELIRDAARLLAPGGTLVFCTNLRRFRLDESATAGLDVEEISRRTIPPDFAGNPRIHRCWLLRSGEGKLHGGTPAKGWRGGGDPRGAERRVSTVGVRSDRTPKRPGTRVRPGREKA